MADPALKSHEWLGSEKECKIKNAHQALNHIKWCALSQLQMNQKTFAPFSALSINYLITELILHVLEAQEKPLYHLRQTLSWVHTELL